MHFDTTHQLGDEPQVNKIEEGVQLVLPVASFLPTPQGMVPLPQGVHRFPMSTQTAETLLERLTAALDDPEEEGEKPAQKKSDLVVAQNLNGIDKIAAMDKQIKGK